MTARQRIASRRPCPTRCPPRIYIPQEVHAMRRIGFYLFIMAVFLLAPLLALPQKAVPALHVQSKTVTGIDYPAASCCNENVWQWEKTAS